MTQRPVEQTRVAVAEALEFLLVPAHEPPPRSEARRCLAGLQPARRQHRCEREGHEQREQGCRGDDQGELAEPLPGNPGHETYWREDDDVDEGDGDGREPDLTAPL